MAFDFQAYRNPYVSTIAELLSRGEDAKAKALVDVANAQARAAEARGQAYGGAIDSVGKMVAGLPAQIQANKNAQEDRAARAEERARQRQQFGNEQTVFTQGQTDRSNQQLVNKATTEEQVLLLPPELQGSARQRLQAYAGDTIRHNNLVSAVKTSEADAIGKVARDVQSAGYNPVAFSLGLDHLAGMGVDVAALKQQVAEHPENLKLLVDHYAGYGAPKPISVDRTHDLVNSETGKVIRPGIPAELTVPEIQAAQYKKYAADEVTNGRTPKSIQEYLRAPVVLPMVTVRGPDGKPVQRRMTAQENETGVPIYEKPTTDQSETVGLRNDLLRQQIEEENLKANAATMAQELSKKAAVDTAQGTVDVIENLVTIDPKTGDVTGLAPGTSSLFGARVPFISSMPGTNAATADAYLKQLTSERIVELIGEMKSQSRTGSTGFGQLNIEELKVLQQASSVLGQRNISDATALKEITKIYNIARKYNLPMAGVPAETPVEIDKDPRSPNFGRPVIR